ncbi:hypothetical protein LCGC14_2209020 [marine sediment metagenome]|uniref:Uncharacterized protein n=1 Tax=marine sediment metagenome TaxID=412755 RepID=A0A0F9E1V8_9ZZZZ
MIKMASFNQGPEKELVLRCDCGDDHFLIFDYWSFDGEEDVYLTLSDLWRSPSGLWGRFWAAMSLFRKGEYCRGAVQINQTNLIAISRWCSQFIRETETTAAG